MDVQAVSLRWEEGCNIVVGQSHFIKTVEDVAEIVTSTVPGAEYGLAFCEASGPCLIRTEGNDEKLVAVVVACLALQKRSANLILKPLASCNETGIAFITPFDWYSPRWSD